MKIILLAVLCIVSVLAAPKLAREDEQAIPECDEDKCKLPNCQCSSTVAPISGDIPQLVMLSFDDAVARLIYEQLWEPNFLNRKNPDGCPISGTFFVPHEYSDYQVVNTLYNKGFEIASHTITKNALAEYWKKASKDVLIKEFKGQRDILAKYANVPPTKIIGARTPLFQINENTFEALNEGGFKYDSSWPTLRSRPFFPHSLDYESGQSCHVDKCQTKSVPGFWVLPIVDWVNQENTACNSLLGCSPEGTAEDVFEWMKENFDIISKDGEEDEEPSRSPITLNINYAWFSGREENKKALTKFLDYLGKQKDVYLVSHSQVLAWSQKPTNAFNSCQKITATTCKPVVCKLQKDGVEKYMTICTKCPKEYPWL